jgi:glycine cleavage system H protein
MNDISRIGSSKFFTPSHEWIQDEGKGIARIGISSFAQEQLGEIVYCDLPAQGSKFSQGQTLCTLESVKAVGEVYTPMDGEVVEVNPLLEETPERVHQDCFGAGWLVLIAPSRWAEDLTQLHHGSSLLEAAERRMRLEPMSFPSNTPPPA